jgi:hypothetical protein
MGRAGPPALVGRYAGRRAYHPAAGDCLTRDVLMAKAKGDAARLRVWVGQGGFLGSTVPTATWLALPTRPTIIEHEAHAET